MRTSRKLRSSSDVSTVRIRADAKTRSTKAPQSPARRRQIGRLSALRDSMATSTHTSEGLHTTIECSGDDDQHCRSPIMAVHKTNSRTLLLTVVNDATTSI